METPLHDVDRIVRWVWLARASLCGTDYGGSGESGDEHVPDAVEGAPRGLTDWSLVDLEGLNITDTSNATKASLLQYMIQNHMLSFLTFENEEEVRYRRVVRKRTV